MRPERDRFANLKGLDLGFLVLLRFQRQNFRNLFFIIWIFRYFDSGKSGFQVLCVSFLGIFGTV